MVGYCGPAWKGAAHEGTAPSNGHQGTRGNGACERRRCLNPASRCARRGAGSLRGHLRPQNRRCAAHQRTNSSSSPILTPLRPRRRGGTAHAALNTSHRQRPPNATGLDPHRVPVRLPDLIRRSDELPEDGMTPLRTAVVGVGAHRFPPCPHLQRTSTCGAVRGRRHRPGDSAGRGRAAPGSVVHRSVRPPGPLRLLPLLRFRYPNTTATRWLFPWHWPESICCWRSRSLPPWRGPTGW